MVNLEKIFTTTDPHEILASLPYSVEAKQKSWRDKSDDDVHPDDWCLENIGKQLEVTKSLQAERFGQIQYWGPDKNPVQNARFWMEYSISTDDEALWALSPTFPRHHHFKHKHHAVSFRVIYG